MRLMINGERRAFTPIKTFRALHHLPESFGVAWFEPKDYDGLGSLDRAGADLNAVRTAIIAAAAGLWARPPSGWFEEIERLQAQFRAQLLAINERVGLREPEIDFAESGFGDVLRACAYARLRARAAKQTAPSFAQVYAGWLDSTVRVASTVHEYAHEGALWRVQVVNHAYGRAGLLVDTGADMEAVADFALGCPAEGFMMTLLHDIAG